VKTPSPERKRLTGITIHEVWRITIAAVGPMTRERGSILAGGFNPLIRNSSNTKKSNGNEKEQKFMHNRYLKIRLKLNTGIVSAFDTTHLIYGYIEADSRFTCKLSFGTQPKIHNWLIRNET
jgi:hypothetical protein